LAEIDRVASSPVSESESSFGNGQQRGSTRADTNQFFRPATRCGLLFRKWCTSDATLSFIYIYIYRPTYVADLFRFHRPADVVVVFITVVRLWWGGSKEKLVTRSSTNVTRFLYVHFSRARFPSTGRDNNSTLYDNGFENGNGISTFIVTFARLSIASSFLTYYSTTNNLIPVDIPTDFTADNGPSPIVPSVHSRSFTRIFRVIF